MKMCCTGCVLRNAMQNISRMVPQNRGFSKKEKEKENLITHFLASWGERLPDTLHS